MPLMFDNTYARELDGCFVRWSATPAPRPRLLFFNAPLAAMLGLDQGLDQGPDQGLDHRSGTEPPHPQAPDAAALEREGDPRAAVWSGNALLPGMEPIAQAYAGHQFGGFSPQLGDGRALLLGEVIDRAGERRDLALKGSGRTPFSRGGDGKAAVGPMLREVIIGEALHALGIPSSRALAVVATGEWVQRDRALPGAVLTRVAASHLRVGTFEYFAARGDHERLARLVRYAAARHAPQALAQPDPALGLLEAVIGRQAQLVAHWMAVGFIHGVMNTDNMTVSGESIDFGPCAFMEAHDPATVFSSIDHYGRYAYGQQPGIAQWNLARLAEALIPVMLGAEDQRVEQAVAAVQTFEAHYADALARLWIAKLGWDPVEPAAAAGAGAPTAATRSAARDLVQVWHALLQRQEVDHTVAWRRLADAAEGHEAALLDLFEDPAPVQAWLQRWRDEAQALGLKIEAARLRRRNPFVIPRNHLVEAALEAASTTGDLEPFESLLAAVRQPWDENALTQAYGQPAAAEVTRRYRTFCGT